MKQKNIQKVEFIGKSINIVKASNLDNINISGTIIDETHHTFKVQTKQKLKTLFKKNITFKTKINDKNVLIEGKYLDKNPKQRIKNK